MLGVWVIENWEVSIECKRESVCDRVKVKYGQGKCVKKRRSRSGKRGFETEKRNEKEEKENREKCMGNRQP